MTSYYTKLPEPSTILVRNPKFLVAEGGLATNRSLLVDNRKIKMIASEAEIRRKYKGDYETIDANGCMVMPGLVNTHSHIGMSMLRGYAEGLPLLSWLKARIWPAEAKLKPKQIELGAALGAVEMVLSGTTSAVSMYFYSKEGSEASAMFNVGLRGIATHSVFEWTRDEALKRTEEFVRDWHGKDDGRIRIATSPHSPYTCGPETLKQVEAKRLGLNEKYGSKYRILNSMHVAEATNEVKEIESNYKVKVNDGVAAYLGRLGVLTKDMIAAHCIHLTENDLKALKRSSASVASCPLSNLKLGMGVARLSQMMARGINVSIATDGAASSNLLDMFEAMKFASLLQKGVNNDPTLMSAKGCFDAATINGAKAMHQDAITGSLKEGKRADLVIMQLDGPNSMPIYDPYNYLVFAARSGDVRDVVVDGRIIVKDRQVTTVDMGKLREEVASATEVLGT